MDPDAAVGAYPVITLANNATETVYHQIKIPSDYVSFISANIIIIAGATGNMQFQGGVKWGEVCIEPPDTHGGTLPAMSFPMIGGAFTCIGLSTPISVINSNDFAGGYFTRLGAHAEDTIEASCYYCGIILRYQT